MLRDFSDEAKSKLLSLIDSVDVENHMDATSSLNRGMSHYGAYTSGLNIGSSIKGVENYHKSVKEKNQAAKKQIEKIFTEVKSVDAKYSGNIANVSQSVQQLIQYVKEMSQIVTVNSGLFSHGYISTKLTPMMNEIDKFELIPVEKVEVNQGEFEQIQKNMLTYNNGRPDFNVGGIVGYLASNANELSFLEKSTVGDVLTYMRDTAEFYSKLATMNPLAFTQDIIEAISWLGEDNLLEKLSQTKDYYGQVYDSTVGYFVEQAQIEGTFANQIVESAKDNGPKVLKGVGTMLLAATPLGPILSGTKTLINKAQSGAEIKYTNEHLGRDYEESLTNSQNRNEWNKNLLEHDTGKRTKTKEYDKFLDLGSVSIKEEKVNSEYTHELETFNNGTITTEFGRTEMYYEASAGMSVLTADGDYVLAPHLHAEMGASYSLFQNEWDQQWLGDENLGLSTKTKVTAGTVSGTLGTDAQILNEEGKLDVELAVGGSLEATAAAAEGEVKLNVLGGGASVKGEVSFGIGAHFEAGYSDGVLKVDVGAALGLGAAVDFELDVGGMINTVSDWCSSALLD